MWTSRTKAANTNGAGTADNSDAAMVGHFTTSRLRFFSCCIYYQRPSFVFLNWRKESETDFISYIFSGSIILPKFMFLPPVLPTTHSGD